MNIDGVSTGIVLDHIKAGKSMQIYELLRLDKINNCVAIIQNADSSKYGKKDIIKIDQLIDLDFDVLGYAESKYAPPANLQLNQDFFGNGIFLLAVQPASASEFGETPKPTVKSGRERKARSVFFSRLSLMK